MIVLKFLGCAAIIALVSCEELHQLYGLNYDNHNSVYASGYKNYQPRDYHFNYAVSDPHTGDHKSQWEVKDKGVVRGGYSLLEPDGTTRVVEYIADDDGFRAVVKKIGSALHPNHEHVEVHGATEPIAAPQPAIIEQPHYQSYDGQIENYIGSLNGEEPLYKNIEEQQAILQQYHQPTEPILYKQIEAHQQPAILQSNVQYHQPELLYNKQPELIENQPILYKQIATHQQPAILEDAVQYHQPQLVYNKQPEVVHHQSPVINYLSGYHQQPLAQSYQEQSHGPVHESSQYHGLTGNADDDSAYTNYDTLGSYTQNTEINQNYHHGHVPQKQFVIYYPQHQ